MAEDVLQRADELAQQVAGEMAGVISFLSVERAKRPPYPRDRADVDIAATRVGRMLQLLQAARLMGRQHFGTAMAPVARAMWETWLDTAWMLREPQTRMERATAFWTAGMAQQLGVIRTLHEQDGYLVPELQAYQTELEGWVKAEPHLYSRWLDDQAQPKCSVHKVRWTNVNARARAEKMGPMYAKSYGVDYTLLSVSSHGEGMELPRLIREVEGATYITVGEGKEAAANLLVLCSGTGLTLVYELQHAYAGGHSPSIEELRARIESLSKECPIII